MIKNAKVSLPLKHNRFKVHDRKKYHLDYDNTALKHQYFCHIYMHKHKVLARCGKRHNLTSF